VTIHASSFRPSPSTYFLILAWLREDRRFHEECLLIPSEEIRAVCKPHESEGHLSFDWHPGSPSGHLVEWQQPQETVAGMVRELLAESRSTE